MNNIQTITQNAINWAKFQIGSTDYSLRCLCFVEDAIELSNNIEIFGGSSAKESSDMYGVSSRDNTNNQGAPPVGAFVFYDCFGTIQGKYENWGHVGISLGNGDIIHAWDKVRIDSYLDVENLQAAPGWSSLKFSGWVPIERVLMGAQDKDWTV